MLADHCQIKGNCPDATHLFACPRRRVEQCQATLVDVDIQRRLVTYHQFANHKPTQYSQTPKTTLNGTPVPDSIYFIELTGWSSDKSYACGKSYNIKAYKVDYATFDYDSLPRKNASDRRSTSSLRVYSFPPGSEDVVRQQTGYTSFKFK